MSLRDDYATTNVHLPRELLERLNAAARERVVGRNLLVARLLEDGLDRLPPLEGLTGR